MSRFAVIIPAAGRSSRFQDRDKKPFMDLHGRAVWLHSADIFLRREDVVQVIVVISEHDWHDFHSTFQSSITATGIEVVKGGTERADSVSNALQQVSDEADFIAVHDAARPCLQSSLVDAVFARAIQTNAAILALPVAATLKHSDNGETVSKTVPRENLWTAQTPQVFRRDILLAACAQRGDLQPTDESQLIEQAGHTVSLVEGSPLNFKITTRQDFDLATRVMEMLDPR